MSAAERLRWVINDSYAKLFYGRIEVATVVRQKNGSSRVTAHPGIIDEENETFHKGIVRAYSEARRTLDAAN